MTDAMIPQDYDEWYHCITVKCGIELTDSFIDQRIKALESDTDYKTQQFVQLYGQAHYQKVLSWFHQAKKQA